MSLIYFVFNFHGGPSLINQNDGPRAFPYEQLCISMPLTLYTLFNSLAGSIKRNH